MFAHLWLRYPCSRRILLSLTLQFSHSRPTQRVKALGAWSCSLLVHRTVTFCSVHIRRCLRSVMHLLSFSSSFAWSHFGSRSIEAQALSWCAVDAVQPQTVGQCIGCSPQNVCWLCAASFLRVDGGRRRMSRQFARWPSALWSDSRALEVGDVQGPAVEVVKTEWTNAKLASKQTPLDVEIDHVVCSSPEEIKELDSTCILHTEAQVGASLPDSGEQVTTPRRSWMWSRSRRSIARQAFRHDPSARVRFGRATADDRDHESAVSIGC